MKRSVRCWVEQNDEAYRAWHREAMTALEPFTVGQYWGDSDQTVREAKTLTDDAWARLQQIEPRVTQTACLLTTSPARVAFVSKTVGKSNA